jgi:hypothetical protein
MQSQAAQHVDLYADLATLFSMGEVIGKKSHS